MKIKRTSSFVKGSALQHANLATAIDQSEVQVGSCGHPLTGRPLFMVGNYDICFECYEKRQRKIESSLPAEASVNVKQFRGLVHQRNELLSALQLALRYLEHPDVLAVTRNMAVSGETVNERITAVIAKALSD